MLRVPSLWKQQDESGASARAASFGRVLTRTAYRESIIGIDSKAREELQEGTRARWTLLTISHRRRIVCFEGVSTKKGVHQEGVSEFHEKVRPVSLRKQGTVTMQGYGTGQGTVQGTKVCSGKN
jgi:hypothetical protein